MPPSGERGVARQVRYGGYPSNHSPVSALSDFPACTGSQRRLVLLLSVATPTPRPKQSEDSCQAARGNTSDENGGRRGDREDMQARMLSSLRERLEVPDDEE